MIEIGKKNVLHINRSTDFGMFLDGEELGEILLPNRYIPDNCQIGDEIEVFIYSDSEDRLVAVTDEPYAMVGEIASLKVKAVNFVGAFLDWGLPKDLLVPFREQKLRMEVGKSYIVYIFLDEETKRIAATSKIDRYLQQESTDFTEGEEVELIIYQPTDLGYKAIINRSCLGMLYKNEIFTNLEIGQTIKGYIKKIREDKKIDLSLQKADHKHFKNLSEQILHMLKENDGFLGVSDKSSPELIYEMFGVSKKNFKIAIGGLYKDKKIILSKDSIRLV